MQNVSICQVEGNTFTIQCSYLSGSDANGCFYILVSGVDGMENVTGRIERGNSGEETLAESPGVIELLAFDWEADGTIGDINVTRTAGNIEPCHIVAGK